MDFPGHFQHIFQQLNHQRLHAQLCDCVVVVGGQTFQAHRSILAACSSHFRALLNSSDEMEGADGGRDGGPSVLTLDPGVVTPEAFSTLLDMIYTSTLSLGASNVMDVLLAASHLHLNTVVKACKLHLSRKNFPAAPPKGWRSVQQQQQSASSQAAARSQQQVSSVMIVDLDKEEVGMEVSQSGGDEESEVRIIEPAATSQQRKRRSQEDVLCDRKRAGGAPGENYKECSPTVTRSVVGTEEGDLLSPDCLMSIDRLWESQSVDSNQVKSEAEKGDSEEMQLPSQSDSGTGDASAWEKTHNTDGGFVVKIKEGEDETKEPQVALIEVKTENTGLFSSEIDTLQKSSPPLPLQDRTNNLDGNLSDGKMTTSPVQADVSSLQIQLCTDLHSNAHKESEDLGEDSVDGEGLESLSELAFTCFLNPSSENVMGGLEEDDSLASLTAAATAAAAASDAHVVSTDSGQQSQKATEGKSASDSSSSLVFPVTSVPLQQLLPEQSTSFSDTIILQPAQNPLTGFLSGIRPGLTLEASLVPPSRVCKNSGGTTTTFRRIAPKVPPGSETGTDPCSVGDATRPPLTRASEDVLSKCKKAAAEDHVLLVKGEKKYACKICCKTFMNLTDCKKHIRVHTGEKPYPCTNCGKRFSQSSHLYKHSKNTCLNWKDDHSFSDSLLLPTDLVKDS